MSTDLPTNNLSLVKPDGISQKQENFARHYVAHGSVVEAYVHAYDVAPTTNRNSLRAHRVQRAEQSQGARTCGCITGRHERARGHEHRGADCRP